MNSEHPQDPAQIIKSLRAERDEIASALLASGPLIVTGEDGNPVEVEPNLVHRAKQLVNERAKLRAELDKEKAPANAVMMERADDIISFTDDIDNLRAELEKAREELAIVTDSHNQGLAQFSDLGNRYEKLEKQLAASESSRKELVEAFSKLKQITPEPPIAITWEQGVEILNTVQKMCWGDTSLNKYLAGIQQALANAELNED